MKKPLSKAEKIVLIIGSIIIIIVLVLGLLKNTFAEEKAFVPSNPNPSEVEDQGETLELKKESFEYALGEDIDENASTYFKNDVDTLKDVVLNFENVNKTTPGTYDVSATKGDDKVNFKIIIAQASQQPVMTADNTEIVFTIEENSNINEIITFANVRAKDSNGNDISSSITGWPIAVPKEAKTETYSLTAVDSAGNKATLNIVVHYSLP